MQRSMQTKSTTTASEQVLGQNDVVECWRDAPFRDKLNVTCCRERERDQVRDLPGVVWRLRQDWNIPQCAVEVWIPLLCSDDGEVEEVFTSTTVRTRDAVFPLLGHAGTKPATEAELERDRERPDPEELRR